MTTLALVVLLLAAHNLVGNLLLPSASYVPVNLAVAAVLVALARASGTSWAQLGMCSSRVGRGAALGGAALLLVAIALVVAALTPATRPLFHDERAVRLDGAATAYHALIRIPLGTVVLEEVAFRGVLLALLSRTGSTTTAVAWSCALFGLWHVVPTIEALRVNEVTPGALPVIAAVIATAAAGAVFCWLRLRSGSLVAPALAHIGTNSVALLVAAAAR